MAATEMNPPVFIFFIIVLAIPLCTLATSSSPFEFIKNLQGCQKGENVKDLHMLKSYLHRFGYLTNVQNTANDDDQFDDNLEAALKTYQLNYHLNATGVLDADTASKMTMPRCGVPDITNGTNHMQTTGKKPHHHHHYGYRKNLHTVSHFSFFPGNLKWPKSQLTYGFYQSLNPNIISAVGRAFDQWASASQYFTFSQVDDASTADLKIGFESGDHGDGSLFDASILAHAFWPTDGRFHYNSDMTWWLGTMEGYHDIETVALHEIGHLLGLGHSSVEDSIMFPGISPGATKGLNADDIQGIKALYNV